MKHKKMFVVLWDPATLYLGFCTVLAAKGQLENSIYLSLH